MRTWFNQKKATRRVASLAIVITGMLVLFRPVETGWSADAPDTKAADQATTVSAATDATATSGTQSTQRGPTPVEFSFLQKAIVPEASTTDTMARIIPQFPPEIQKLAGKRLRIKGFMVPYESLDDLRNFMILPTQVGCFFCSVPDMTQVVLVRLDTKKKVDFIDGPIEVEGTMKLFKEHSPDDPDLESFLYTLDQASVKAVK